jgi:hypothetical protein
MRNIKLEEFLEKVFRIFSMSQVLIMSLLTIRVPRSYEIDVYDAGGIVLPGGRMSVKLPCQLGDNSYSREKILWWESYVISL